MPLCLRNPNFMVILGLLIYAGTIYSQTTWLKDNSRVSKSIPIIKPLCLMHWTEDSLLKKVERDYLDYNQHIQISLESNNNNDLEFNNIIM